MTVITFDTLRFVDTLREAGVPDRHARAICRAVRDAHEAAELDPGRDLPETAVAIRGKLRTLGTSLASDMQAFRSELQSAMRTLGAELKTNMQAFGSERRSDIQALRAELRAIELRLTIRLSGIVVVALGAFTALSKWIA